MDDSRRVLDAIEGIGLLEVGLNSIGEGRLLEIGTNSTKESRLLERDNNSIKGV